MRFTFSVIATANFYWCNKQGSCAYSLVAKHIRASRRVERTFVMKLTDKRTQTGLVIIQEELKLNTAKWARL